MAERRLPPSLRRGRRQTSMGGLIALRANKEDLEEFADALRRKAKAIREIGGNRATLVRYISEKPEYVSAMLAAWRKALYGPSAMTQWFSENVRDESLKGIEGFPEAGVPVDSGALQAALTEEQAEGAISDVLISRDGRITFRYAAAPERQYAPFEPNSTKEAQASKPFDKNSTYLDEINEFYGEGGEGFFEIGLEEMSKSERLRECWLEIGNIMASAARAYIKEKSR